jgi:poly(3-hydroxybutyrate) depolymerase
MSTHVGLRRQRWLVHIPAGYSPTERHRTVVLLHDDAGATPESALAETGLVGLADEHGFIVVAPEERDFAAGWMQPSDHDDARRAVAQTRAQTCVDPDKIFVIGHGAGGNGAYALSCDDWVGGVAAVAHVPRAARKATCTPQRPIPFFQILPTESEYLPEEGGTNCLNKLKSSFDELEEAWQRRGRCRADTERVWFEHPEGVCRTWQCAHPVVSCRASGGRQWPGAPARGVDVLNCDGPATKFPHTETIWRFFSEL